MSEWWPVADAAQFTETSRRSIHRWVAHGRLTHREQRGVTLVDLDELVELLDHRGAGGRLPKTPKSAAT